MTRKIWGVQRGNIPFGAGFSTGARSIPVGTQFCLLNRMIIQSIFNILSYFDGFYDKISMAERRACANDLLTDTLLYNKAVRMTE